ncbi:MAG: RDD family protein [Dissulfurispiraceae bacterium]
MSEGPLKASLLLRVMAKTLDCIIIAAALKAIPRVGFMAALAYLLICDGLFDGRSLGKKVMRLKVVSSSTASDGSYRDSMIRNAPFALGLALFNIPFIGWVFPILILAFEFLLALGNDEGIRLGDEFAGTKVVEG